MYKKRVLKEVLPELPEGIVIADKPDNADVLARTRSKWIEVAKHLAVIGATQTIQIPLGNLLDTPGKTSKNRLGAIKAGIRKTYFDLGYKGKMRFLVKNDILMVWVNK